MSHHSAILAMHGIDVDTRESRREMRPSRRTQLADRDVAAHDNLQVRQVARVVVLDVQRETAEGVAVVIADGATHHSAPEMPNDRRDDQPCSHVDGAGKQDGKRYASHGVRLGGPLAGRTRQKVLMQSLQRGEPRIGDVPVGELRQPRVADLSLSGDLLPIAPALLQRFEDFHVE